MNLISLFRDGADEPESPYAWLRLSVAVLIGTIGNVGMWSVAVTLPLVQAEFGVDRAAASLPYTFTMIGFGAGAIVLGRVVDKIGILLPLIGGALMLSAGYLLTAAAPTIGLYTIAQGALIGTGTGAFFAPMMADISHWFVKRRGIAVTVCAAGNYLAGAVWPIVVQHFSSTVGWRATHVGIAIFCVLTIIPLSFVLRRRPPEHAFAFNPAEGGGQRPAMGVSPNMLMAIMCVAGVACCMAMSMPQVHIVAYCGDLGYGVARGAEMLSLMLAFGIISRIASGFIADRVGGVGTLVIGSALQGVALVLYFMFDGLVSLYVISALFGLFQGGIVPSYAIIVREYFSPREAATRVSIVITATIAGMALGGWLSGVIFDLTGSYRAAFGNGIAWNLLNLTIALWLLTKPKRHQRALAAA
ncbi:MAG: MFS transporter [Pseudolabrys sp.]|nr:MFS transporter [Pseudolabrys sp.]MBV9262556.1 MFS transporter [Pseudolabrys sp.]